MSEIDEFFTESPAPKPSRRVGNGLVAVALILPVIAAVVLMFVTSFGLALAISGATVVLSSVLVALDAHRLENVDLTGRTRESAIILFLGMCALWIGVYPYAFFRRRKFGGPDLFVPSLLVAVFFLVGPVLRAILVPPGLPSCTSREVVNLLEEIIHKTPIGARAKSIDGHIELSYDRAADRRTGQCVAHLDGKDVVVNYIVQWRDRKQNLFEVRIPPPDLPSCTSQEVAQLMAEVIRKTPVGAKAKSVDGFRDLSYDRAADRRTGQCVAHLESGDTPVKFIVQWRDRDKGQFEVRVIE